MEYVIEAHDTDDMRSWLATIKYCMRTMVPNQDGRLVATSAILYNQGYNACKVGEKIKLIKLCGLSPRANYTDRAAAAGRRS